MNKMYLVIGDWSYDGHGKYEKILVSVNKEVIKVQEAYKSSCKLTGISFNHSGDFTGKEEERGLKEAGKYRISAEYKDNSISKEVEAILCEYNYPMSKFDNYKDCFYLYQDSFVDLWFWFVGLSLPDLEWKKVEDDIPVINGYWDDNLNIQLGYGIFLD